MRQDLNFRHGIDPEKLRECLFDCWHIPNVACVEPAALYHVWNGKFVEQLSAEIARRIRPRGDPSLGQVKRLLKLVELLGWEGEHVPEFHRHAGVNRPGIGRHLIDDGLFYPEHDC